jgi:hypothetical protein
MENHDIEIEISNTGEVKIHVKGAKGKTCLSYVEFFENVVGKVREQQLTHEYYEPESKVRVEIQNKQHVHESNE